MNASKRRRGRAIRKLRREAQLFYDAFSEGFPKLQKLIETIPELMLSISLAVPNVAGAFDKFNTEINPPEKVLKGHRATMEWTDEWDPTPTDTSPSLSSEDSPTPS